MKVIFKLSSEYLAIRNDLFIKNEQTCPEINLDNLNKIVIMFSWADPGFQVRGALKKIAPSGGRRENVWGISCGKSRFYAKKIIFFQF
jgi:hypothetical protein